MKIGYLGPKATFTDLAVNKLFGIAQTLPFKTIPECMDAVVENQIELTVVPVENAIEGSVNITLDYIVHEVDIPIVGEITVPIKQHFMVHPDNVHCWQEANEILSHSHALAQCHKFLHQQFKGIYCENTTSTAAAAQLVRDQPERNIAAIANELAAKEYGLVIVKRDIHDFDYNHTRFLVLSKKVIDFNTKEVEFSGFKTTLMITLPSDFAGALHQVLSAFAWRKINLSKIESRPMKTGLGNYFFIVDIEMKMDDILIPGTISELTALGCAVKVLGSYPSFRIEEQ